MKQATIYCLDTLFRLPKFHLFLSALPELLPTFSQNFTKLNHSDWPIGCILRSEAFHLLTYFQKRAQFRDRLFLITFLPTTTIQIIITITINIIIIVFLPSFYSSRKVTATCRQQYWIICRANHFIMEIFA